MQYTTSSTHSKDLTAVNVPSRLLKLSSKFFKIILRGLEARLEVIANIQFWISNFNPQYLENGGH